MADIKAAERKKTLIKLGVLVLVAGVVGLLLLRGINIKGRIDWGISLLQACGPIVFLLRWHYFQLLEFLCLRSRFPWEERLAHS